MSNIEIRDKFKIQMKPKKSKTEQRRAQSNSLAGLFLPLIVVAFGCSKSNGPSPSVQPVAAQEQAKGEPAKSAESKEEIKGVRLAAGGSFTFPADDGGKILGQILPPKAPAPLGPLPAKIASERSLPAYLAAPDAATIPASLAPRPYPQPMRVASRPTPLPDRVPSDLAKREVDLPESVVLPVGALTKIDPLDVKQSVALPILARPTTDRASLEDPTTEFTARSIVNNNLPLRVTLSLFVKVNLPDPFENAEPAKVKITIPDDPAKALGNPPLPRP
jgi:hypothetical protein